MARQPGQFSEFDAGPPATPEEVAEFIADMLEGMCDMAAAANLSSLAYFLVAARDQALEHTTRNKKK